ncbi:ABC transporter ATP-binding protein [Jiella sonneratiae]|uniref:ABC transporter ATP-binding protein n=1 Tax=Jiella sonneratiae TaxID=2816856 RepID=UPI00315A98F5
MTGRDKAPAAARQADDDVVIRARGVTVAFGGKKVLDDLSLDVRRGEILGFVGPSGAGKSVLLRTILGLNAKDAGTIEVFGIDYDRASDRERLSVERRWGVLFQHGALFSALTVRENIEVPMKEYLDLSPKLMHELAMLKIDLVGLAPDAADKYPSELSGGMIKRAALARALALDPEIVFLDEPTSGLDPIGAADFDQLIMTLRDTLGLSVYMVTHDLDSLFQACDRIAVLGERKVLVEGPLAKMLDYDHPWVKSYFHGKRARTIVTNDAKPARPTPFDGAA